MKNIAVFIAASLLLFSCTTGNGGKGASGNEAVLGIEDTQSALFEAIMNLDLQVIATEQNLNQVNSHGDTALMVATASGSPGICAFLLSRGADPNRTNRFGETALHYACRYGYLDIADMLNDAGADSNKEDAYGVTPQELCNNAWNPQNSPTVPVDRFKDFEILYDKQKAIARYDYELLDKSARRYREEWMSFVSRNATESLEIWLSMEDCTFPSTIQEPDLPPAIVLKQEQWEVNNEFQERVQNAQQKRQIEITGLQEQYRQDVETRNNTILYLKSVQDVRMARLDEYRASFIEFSLMDVVSGTALTNPQMDKDTGDLTVDAVSPSGDKVGTFLVTALDDSDFRKAAFQDISSFEFNILPTVSTDGSFTVGEGKITFNNKNYSASLTSESIAMQEAMVATIDLSTEAESLARSQLQNPNLVDRNAIGEITYKDGTRMLVDFNDDLSPRIAQAPKAPVDSTQWAFVVGAEDYMNTDDIIYSRRSAELFIQTLERIKGIPPGQIITLLDSQATSGNIKTKLQMLLEQGISQGDTVYFYYNGHGIPAASEQNEPYMLPTDMIQDYVTTEPFFKLENIYNMLEESKAGTVVVFMDSCFTGKTDGVSVFKGMAATRLAPKKTEVGASGNVVILAAGNNNQFSSAWPDKGLRLFTYYVIEAFLEGRSSVEELYSYVSENVSATSREIGGIDSMQDPTVMGNTTLKF
jgi:Ankyrin repeats (3 copies)